MQLIQKISMDFAVHGIPPRVYGKQDDSLSRAVQIHLFNNGEPWDIPAGAAMMVRYQTRTGATGFYDTLPDGTSAFTVTDGNCVTVVLVDQIFATDGVVSCELRIMAEGAGVSTWTFIVVVDKSANSDATLDSNYLNYLTALSSQVAADAKRAEDAANSVDTTLLMNRTLYDPDGAVETAGGIPQYVAKNAPKTNVVDSVTSTSATDAASAAAVKKAYDKAESGPTPKTGIVSISGGTTSIELISNYCWYTYAGNFLFASGDIRFRAEMLDTTEAWGSAKLFTLSISDIPAKTFSVQVAKVAAATSGGSSRTLLSQWRVRYSPTKRGEMFSIVISTDEFESSNYSDIWLTLCIIGAIEV